MELIHSFLKSKSETDVKHIFESNFYGALQNLSIVVLLFTVRLVRGREDPAYEWHLLSCFELNSKALAQTNDVQDLKVCI